MNDSNVRLWPIKRTHNTCSGLRSSRVAQVGQVPKARFYVYRLFFRDVPGKLDATKSVKRWVLERTPIPSPNDTRSAGDDVEVGIFTARSAAEDAMFVDASRLGRFGEGADGGIGTHASERERGAS